VKTCVLIPAFNCAALLPEVCRRVPGLSGSDEIIVVDDGSSDDTFKVAASLPRVAAFQNPRNSGYGATSSRLYMIALERNADYTVNLHGDLGHRPEDVGPLLDRLKGGTADVVMGSRLLFVRAAIAENWSGALLNPTEVLAMPAHRVAGHVVLTAFQNVLFGSSLHSFHEGMRGCRKRVIQWATARELPAWYDYDMQLLFQAFKAGFVIEEVPIRPSYDPRVRSAAPSVRYGLRVVANSVKLALGKAESERA